MKHVLARYCRATAIFLFICMVAMAAIMNSLVVTRYFFSYSPPWTEEVTRYLMVWMVMLGAATLALFDDHITLYLFREKMGHRARLVHGIVVRAIVLAVAALTAWTGYVFAFSMWNILAPGSGLSMTVPTLAVPVSMTLIAIFAIIRILGDLRELAGGGPPELPEQSDIMDGSFKPADPE
ncbi:MAG: TRAP transporter small permease [Geminicoccaceae bacterium]